MPSKVIFLFFWAFFFSGSICHLIRFSNLKASWLLFVYTCFDILVFGICVQMADCMLYAICTVTVISHPSKGLCFLWCRQSRCEHSGPPPKNAKKARTQSLHPNPSPLNDARKAGMQSLHRCPWISLRFLVPPGSPWCSWFLLVPSIISSVKAPGARPLGAFLSSFSPVKVFPFDRILGESSRCVSTWSFSLELFAGKSFSFDFILGESSRCVSTQSFSLETFAGKSFSFELILGERPRRVSTPSFSFELFDGKSFSFDLILGESSRCVSVWRLSLKFFAGKKKILRSYLR